MYIKFTDEEYEYVSYIFLDSENLFQITDKTSQNVISYTPVLHPVSEFDPQNFELYFLYNERDDCGENSIYQVYTNKKRIGWIFPIQALLSDAHNYAENAFFLRYAYVAICLLLEKIEDRDKRNFIPQLKLEDYYKETDNLLILDKENCKEIDGFLLDNYVVDLYKHGYSFVGKGNLTSNIDKPIIRLNLCSQSLELKKITYISKLFKEVIPKEQEPFAKFYTYYQIIEILISVIFEYKFKEFILEINEETENLFDKREDLNKLIIEKQRVKWLFSNFTKIQTENKRILNQCCSRLLELNQKKTTNDCAENLYNVRCLLVHKLYILNNDSYNIIEDLNIAFLDVLIDMILTFSFKIIE